MFVQYNIIALLLVSLLWLRQLRKTKGIISGLLIAH